MRDMSTDLLARVGARFCITCGAEIDKAARVANVCPKCGAVQDTVYAKRKFCGNCSASHHDHPPIKRGRFIGKVKVCPVCDAVVERLMNDVDLKKAIKKMPEIIAIILLLPAILVATFLFPDMDFERLSGKEFVIFMLICYGLLALLVLYFA